MLAVYFDGRNPTKTIYFFYQVSDNLTSFLGFPQSSFLERLCSSNAAPPLDLCLDSIRKDLNEYRGGEVSLTSAGVDQSISVISVSQPGKKNALTGE